jgi:hypothetical protein
MKNLTKYFALLMVGFSTNMIAQATATASIAVNIVTPIGIAKADDMVFGNIATNGSTGTILVDLDGTRTPSGGVSLPAASGSPKAASFVVTGAGNYTYGISLPTSPITLSGATAGVTVATFVSNLASTGKLAAAGTQTVFVGATLNLPASVAAGSYTNASGLSITVNYN